MNTFAFSSEHVEQLREKYFTTFAFDYPFKKTMFSNVRDFFLQPAFYKNTFSQTHDDYLVGYKNLGTKEVFTLRHTHPIPIEFNHCLNYMTALHNAALNYLQAIERYLEFPQKTLLGLVQKDTLVDKHYSPSCLRILYYPKLKNSTRKALPLSYIEPHQDIGLLTFFTKTHSPVLSIYDFSEEGEWIDVEKSMRNEEILIMSGVTLEKITNGYFLPSFHKVDLSFSEERLSFIYFLQATPSKILDSKKFTSPLVEPFREPYKISLRDFILHERNMSTSVSQIPKGILF